MTFAATNVRVEMACGRIKGESIHCMTAKEAFRLQKSSAAIHRHSGRNCSNSSNNSAVKLHQKGDDDDKRLFLLQAPLSSANLQ